MSLVKVWYKQSKVGMELSLAYPGAFCDRTEEGRLCHLLKSCLRLDFILGLGRADRSPVFREQVEAVRTIVRALEHVTIPGLFWWWCGSLVMEMVVIWSSTVSGALSLRVSPQRKAPANGLT